MGRGDGAQTLLCRPAGKRRITGAPRLRHDIAGRKGNGKRSEGNAVCRRNPARQGDLACGFGPQAVIDTGHSNAARKRLGGKQHQCQTVGPTRNRQPKRALTLGLRPQRCKIGSEARRCRRV